ncbi:MAG: TM2 domain-containing protein [SAR202 cluster bacterium]|nr:TM2 domain-containing protein [SAR202 cluster bacterium]|tara:strand:- start:428 stop:745 length:318 start_codon:yes stop_codon:yes gene_type:complete
MTTRISALTIYDLTEKELLLHSMELESRRKSPLVAWALWFFTGALGGHRYYLGNIVRAIFMTLTLGGFGIWSTIDAFFIPRTLRQDRQEVSNQILHEIAAVRDTK